MAHRRSPALLIAAALLALAAQRVAALPGVPLPVVERWEAARPDPRPMSTDELRAVADQGAEERRADLALLLAGLAAGCVALALRPKLARSAGGAAVVVLTAGSVGVGLFSMGASVASQAQDAARGRWSLSDDVLPRLAGPHASTLRGWRELIGEDDVVLLVGSDPRLWNAVLWALHPRAIHPRVLDVPRQLSREEIAVSARRLAPDDGRACWLVDLGALRAPEGAGHPALVRVSP